MPRCIAIVAPAGYGKSVLARQLIAFFPSHATCDCADMRELAQCAQHVTAAVGTHQPGRADFWAAEQLAAIGHPKDAELLAQRAWSTPGPPAAFVFENAEALCDIAGTGRFIRKLLDVHERPIILCSRRPLDVPLGHGLDPSDFAIVGFRELAFSADEARRVAAGASDGEIRRVMTLTEGWPIAVGVIARMGRGTGLDAVLDEAERRQTEELHEYLISQVLSGLPNEVLDALIAAAVIPHASLEELRTALGRDVSGSLAEVFAKLPVSSTDMRVHVHPVVVGLLRERYATRAAQILRGAASALEHSGLRARAAELYLALGDQEAAAAALQDVGAYLISTPTLAESTVLASLDERVLVAFPRLWCAAIVHRGYAMPPDEWLRTSRAIWSNLDAQESPVVRASVAGSVVNAYLNPGRIAEAKAFLDEFAATVGADDPHGGGVVALFSAAIDSYLGKAGCIAASTEYLAPFMATSPVTHAIYLYEIVAPFHRLQGKRDLERETLERSIQLGAGSDMPIFTLVLVQATFAAWFAGEDELSVLYLAQLEARVTPSVARGMRFFIACAHGRGVDEPFGYEKAKVRVEGLLMASSLANDSGAALALARRAIEMADQSSRPFYRIVARVAVAELDAESAPALLDEAQRLAATIDPPALGLAVERLRAGNAGTMLDAFVARFRRLGRSGAVRLHVLEGDIRIDGKSVHVSDREFAMLCALAREPRWYSGAELAEAVFGELDAQSGANRVYVYFHRLRKRFDIHSVVETARKGYRMHPGVEVDIWEWMRLAQRLTTLQYTSLHPVEQRRLLDIARSASGEMRRNLPDALSLHLESLRRKVRTTIATSLLERGRALEALGLAELMLAHDPLSDAAHEVAIRAHLLRGDRAAALAQWETYRADVVRDLQVEPTSDLRRLIN